MKHTHIVVTTMVLILGSASAFSDKPKPRDLPNETVVKGNCDSEGNNCKNLAISFRLDPDIPGSGEQFASAECAERRMLPSDVQKVWTKSGGKYGTRIWMVMCEQP